jgi:hypothetical protein
MRKRPGFEPGRIFEIDAEKAYFAAVGSAFGLSERLFR